MLRGQCAEYGTLVGSGGHCLHGDLYLIGGEESEGGGEVGPGLFPASLPYYQLECL